MNRTHLDHSWTTTNKQTDHFKTLRVTTPGTTTAYDLWHPQWKPSSDLTWPRNSMQIRKLNHLLQEEACLKISYLLDNLQNYCANIRREGSKPRKSPEWIPKMMLRLKVSPLQHGYVGYLLQISRGENTVEDLWANFPRIPKAALRAFAGHFPHPFHHPFLGWPTSRKRPL